MRLGKSARIEIVNAHKALHVATLVVIETEIDESQIVVGRHTRSIDETCLVKRSTCLATVGEIEGIWLRVQASRHGKVAATVEGRARRIGPHC